MASSTLSGTSIATATAAPSASSTPNTSNGPTSSPLLFFVALGFGVVFTNLWIIVGVKYCFRYNQRNRRRMMGEDGNPIDMGVLPRPQGRRRREKKLMTMDDVNERFPLTKYKAWRSQQMDQGLPAAGGVSRAVSVKDVEGVVEQVQPGTDATPATGPVANTLELAQHDHNTRNTTTTRPSVDGTTHDTPRAAETRISTEFDNDDEDGIRAPVQPDALPVPGDACAICLDTLEDDDDIRGLTCGHAFHAACVDPWLTSRRACCPLCKADYYVPKPRTEGETDQMPQAPGYAYLRGRHQLPFWMQAGPRILTIVPRPNQQQQGQDPTAQEANAGGWRSRLPRFGNLLRSNRNATDVQPSQPTPNTLEAGTAAVPAR